MSNKCLKGISMKRGCRKQKMYSVHMKSKCRKRGDRATQEKNSDEERRAARGDHEMSCRRRRPHPLSSMMTKVDTKATIAGCAENMASAALQFGQVHPSRTMSVTLHNLSGNGTTHRWQAEYTAAACTARTSSSSWAKRAQPSVPLPDPCHPTPTMYSSLGREAS